MFHLIGSSTKHQICHPAEKVQKKKNNYKHKHCLNIGKQNFRFITIEPTLKRLELVYTTRQRRQCCENGLYGTLWDHLYVDSAGASAIDGADAIDGVPCPLGPAPIFLTAKMPSTAPVPLPCRVNEP